MTVPGAGPLSAAGVRRMFERLAVHITPRCELAVKNPYELLIAVVLSAQTTDAAVNAVLADLLAVAPDPAALAALEPAAVETHIRRIGLAPTKARNLVGLARRLVDAHDGVVPDERAALEALPGVGRKSAGVVLNLAFGRPEIPVDTHVHRVANRTGIAATADPRRTEEVLLARTPRKHRVHAHSYLILHGRYTCTARRPACDACPLARICRRCGDVIPRSVEG